MNTTEQHPWDMYLGQAERETLEHARFGRRMGFGLRPAIIVVDVQKFLIGQVDHPRDWPSSSPGARTALPSIQQVVQTAQDHRVPVFFTRFEVAPDGRDMGVYRLKRDLIESSNWCLSGTPGAELSEELIVTDNDIEFVKKKPSSFHGTPLTGYLTERGIDTVIVVGGSTSNCVRATVFDASSLNYRTIVVQEAVFDRFPISHAISLFDMDRQFADVTSLDEVLTFLKTCENGFASK